MSVELRFVVEGECECGTPKPIGFKYKCSHHLVCVWGRFGNGEADPRWPLEHLMLIAGDYVTRMLQFGAEPGTRGGTVSCSSDADRLFCHLDYEGKRTTWELFEAHFADGGGPHDLFVGVWPD
jgi:hypothetical protein